MVSEDEQALLVGTIQNLFTAFEIRDFSDRPTMSGPVSGYTRGSVFLHGGTSRAAGNRCIACGHRRSRPGGERGKNECKLNIRRFLHEANSAFDLDQGKAETLLTKIIRKSLPMNE
jgi:hypothetical protein